LERLLWGICDEMIYILFWFVYYFFILWYLQRYGSCFWVSLLMAHVSHGQSSSLILVCEPLYWYIYLKSLWRLWWWYCTPLCYDMIHFMMIMHVIMMYTLWCWCTPIQYDVHAYHSVMMLSYALWCILDVDDAYTVHTEMMMMHTLWQWCIPMMMMHDDACLMFSGSREGLFVQWLCMTRCTRMYMSSVWQWYIYRDDLTVIRVQRLSIVDSEFGMWQVHRFGNLLLIWVVGRGKEMRS